MKNYKLDTSMLPKVWVTWETTKNKQFNKRYWLNCQTGKKKGKPEKWMNYKTESDIYTNRWYNTEGMIGLTYGTRHKPNIWVKSGSNLMYAYAKYHADIERLEVAAVKMDTSRKPEARKWEYAGDRFFIGKDKSIIDEKGNSYNGRRYHITDRKSEGGAKYMLQMLLRLFETKEFVNQFKKFIGESFFTKGNGNIVSIEYPYHLEMWFTTVQKTRKENKSQKIVDNLASIPLTDASNFAEKYPPIIKNRWDDILDIVYFERVNDEWCVLRSFYRNNDNTLRESWRFYIGDNGKNQIMSHSPQGWLPASTVLRTYYNHNSYLVNQEEAIEKCNRIKYALYALKETHRDRINSLITMLRHPVIEQIIKLGGESIGASLAGSHTPKADLKDMFGYYNEKEKSLLRKLGLTKYQFDKTLKEDDHYNTRKTLKEMRSIFGNDLSSLDNKSFDLYLLVGNSIGYHNWGSFDYGCTQLNLDKKKIFKNIVRLYEKNKSIATVICDTMCDYTRLNQGTAPEIDWCFRNASDAIRAHNAIIELKRMQDEERRALWNLEEAERRKKEDERRAKLDEERKQYEYEDDEFIIRLPKDIYEILNEGSVQHICIGGYTSSHATGQTNLFFLRKKSDPDIPFYAIEMNNSKQVVQIHGFGNKWLGNNPEAIPTVIRWLRKNDIKCEAAKLTCKATGYGSTNDYVPMPIVD